MWRHLPSEEKALAQFPTEGGDDACNQEEETADAEHGEAVGAPEKHLGSETDVCKEFDQNAEAAQKNEKAAEDIRFSLPEI